MGSECSNFTPEITTPVSGLTDRVTASVAKFASMGAATLDISCLARSMGLGTTNSGNTYTTIMVKMIPDRNKTDLIPHLLVWIIGLDRNGDRYAGEYYGDKIHGFGVYCFKNGHSYKGSWHEGRKQGFGTYTFRNGETRSGEWNQGVLSNTCSPQFTDEAVDRAVPFRYFSNLFYFISIQ